MGFAWWMVLCTGPGTHFSGVERIFPLAILIFAQDSMEGFSNIHFNIHPQTVEKENLLKAHSRCWLYLKAHTFYRSKAFSTIFQKMKLHQQQIFYIINRGLLISNVIFPNEAQQNNLDSTVIGQNLITNIFKKASKATCIYIFGQMNLILEYDLSHWSMHRCILRQHLDTENVSHWNAKQQRTS